MKKFASLVLILALCLSLHAQKHMTKSGHIGFYSHTPLEDIKADNNQVASILDEGNGEIVFQALMRSFHFEKSLMEEHFNENYIESEKFPKATFAGKIENISSVEFDKEGTYPVTVKGDLTLHGVTRNIQEKGTIEITDNGIRAKSFFKLKPEDFEVEIPSIVREKIAAEMEITVEVNYAAK